ncbi:uncharacterized protein JN550_008678 [Neoarthrinium moseri]|uniref:uncharacterized protein n=1 Tax=Neoarthrinium moseri TaxID=1658444 RepID=UPI001FDB3065|nr:uncharacterized protein JN550_008678 [Neoarthrinium moseri]KAI1864858.1 hypothetical protein JN550_008678 [Neoarthrinium moseri]
MRDPLELEAQLHNDRIERDRIEAVGAVHDCTHRVIPLCAACLVIFSTGAIMVCTLAYEKPLPRGGVIAVSSIFGILTLLFLLGSIKLYRDRMYAHRPRLSFLHNFRNRVNQKWRQDHDGPQAGTPMSFLGQDRDRNGQALPRPELHDISPDEGGGVGGLSSTFPRPTPPVQRRFPMGPQEEPMVQGGRSQYAATGPQHNYRRMDDTSPSKENDFSYMETPPDFYCPPAPARRLKAQTSTQSFRQSLKPANGRTDQVYTYTQGQASRATEGGIQSHGDQPNRTDRGGPPPQQGPSFMAGASGVAGTPGSYNAYKGQSADGGDLAANVALMPQLESIQKALDLLGKYAKPLLPELGGLGGLGLYAVSEAPNEGTDGPSLPPSASGHQPTQAREGAWCGTNVDKANRYPRTNTQSHQQQQYPQPPKAGPPAGSTANDGFPSAFLSRERDHASEAHQRARQPDAERGRQICPIPEAQPQTEWQDRRTTDDGRRMAKENWHESGSRLESGPSALAPSSNGSTTEGLSKRKSGSLSDWEIVNP